MARPLAWLATSNVMSTGPTAPTDLEVADARVTASEVLVATEISKRYDAVRALDSVSLSIHRGELLAVTGHNGAGKSTLIKLIAGHTRSDTGSLTIGGARAPVNYATAVARRLGIRAVDQEVVLCGNLSVLENFLVAHRSLGRVRWRAGVEDVCRRSLEAVFPDNGISARAEVNRLPMAQRQMAAIAFAAYTAPSETPLELLILDEPTSSLDLGRRRQLFEYLAALRSTGAAVMLISHRLDEVLAHSERIVVLRDGRVVGTVRTPEISKATLIDLMGQAEDHRLNESRAPTTARRRAAVNRCDIDSAGKGPLVELAGCAQADLQQVRLSVHRGEVVGLGGLEGNGQRTLLNALYTAANGRRIRQGVRVTRRIAYVSGDRNGEGVFPLWSVERNVSIGSLRALLRWGMVQRRAEARLADRWIRDLDVRVPSRKSVITSLSGGSQQKVLVARVLASDAELILLDDPTRGVDIGTKREIYALIHKAAKEGRSFLWYSTENEELYECDRVLVMREGSIVRELAGEELDERSLIAASFSEGARSAHEARQ